MSAGAVLVAIAVAIVVGAYVARPFRGPFGRGDRAIERWVARARVRLRSERSDAPAFCPECGRPVRPDDRFCSACGAQLGGRP